MPDPGAPPAPHRRHAWSAPFRTAHRTTRACWRCGLEKVTRHEAGPGVRPWIEWHRRGVLLAGVVATPPCTAAPAVVGISLPGGK